MQHHTLTKTQVFKHCVLKGSPYEVGKKWGEIFINDPHFVKFMSSPFAGKALKNSKELSDTVLAFEKYCPGLNDEIKGFSEYTGINYEDIVFYYTYSATYSGHCSHLAVIPHQNTHGSTFLGRNYDYCWEDNPVLCTTYIEGQAAQIGFTLQLLGRYDGMNEYGLCVTTSSCNISVSNKNRGFVFPFVVRAILNQCKCVDEAVNFLMTIPIGEARCYILADKFGKAALVEVAGDKKGVKIIDSNSKETYICSTNHFTLKDMKEHNTDVRWHSLTRYNAINTNLQSIKENVNKDNIKEILSKPIPDGTCCHHYIEGFGTMWSMLFEPEKLSVDICFGSPQFGEWRKFTLDNTPIPKDYKVELYNEPSLPEFWQRVEPGIIKSLLDKFRKDNNIVAVVLDGGFASDEIWREVGLYLTLVVKDKKAYRDFYCIDEDGMNVYLHARSTEEFKRINETAIKSFDTGHEGVLLYTKDDTLSSYFAKTFERRETDREVLLFRFALTAIESIKKAEKSLYLFRDVTDSLVCIMSAVHALAGIEVNMNENVPVRGQIYQAIQYNPVFFHSVYTNLLYQKNDNESILKALDLINSYMEERIYTIFKTLFDYMEETGDLLTTSQLDDFLCKKLIVNKSLFYVYEWLAEKGAIFRASSPIKLSYKNKIQFEEVAYFCNRGGIM